MNRKNAHHALQRVAAMHAVPLPEVIGEIENAIQEAYRHALQQNDPDCLRLWESIPKEGQLPTAEEMIAYLSTYLYIL